MKIIEEHNLYDLSAAEGDLVYTSDTGRFYIYTVPNGWQIFSTDKFNKIQEEIKDTATQLNTLSLYDLNKQLIGQLPNLTPEEIKQKILLIKEFKNIREAEFYMLLSNEIRYYTLFHIDFNTINTYSFEEEVIACLEELGYIKSIELNADGVIEIWVTQDSENTIVLYLFPYDEGVIICH